MLWLKKLIFIKGGRLTTSKNWAKNPHFPAFYSIF